MPSLHFFRYEQYNSAGGFTRFCKRLKTQRLDVINRVRVIVVGDDSEFVSPSVNVSLLLSLSLSLSLHS